MYIEYTCVLAQFVIGKNSTQVLPATLRQDISVERDSIVVRGKNIFLVPPRESKHLT